MLGAPLSCQKISELVTLVREEKRYKVNQGIQADAILDIIDALNKHHSIIATALTEISAYEPGAISEPTYKNLTRLLKLEQAAPLTEGD